MDSGARILKYNPLGCILDDRAFELFGNMIRIEVTDAVYDLIFGKMHEMGNSGGSGHVRDVRFTSKEASNDKAMTFNI